QHLHPFPTRRSSDLVEPAPVEDLKFKSIYAEHAEIMKILQEENFNKTRTAQRLNINRKTLYNKLKTFDMINSTVKSEAFQQQTIDRKSTRLNSSHVK